MFQLCFSFFFSNENLNIIAQNRNRNTRIKKLELDRRAQRGGENRSELFARSS